MCHVTWLPTRLSGERDMPMWIALAVALALMLQPNNPSGNALLAIVVLVVAAIVAGRWRLGWIGIGVLFAVGVALRLGVPNPHGSDVLDVTSTAIRGVLAGQNPWGHGFATSRPPGAPFAYGPLALFWYLPSINDPDAIELLVSFIILGLLALRGRPLGLAVYAAAPTLVLTSWDGSNDTSAGFLILGALVLAARRPWLGAVVLALAVAFKPYALAWAPGLLFYGHLSAVTGFVLPSLAIWGPSLLAWGPGNYLVSLQLADSVHRSPWYSLGVIWETFTRTRAPAAVLDQARLVAGEAAALVGLRFARSIDRVIVVGILVFVIVMFGGYWSTYAYFSAIAPIICWRLDDWLGIPAPAFVASAPWAPSAQPAGVSSAG
jgi:hypothetical protein